MSDRPDVTIERLDVTIEIDQASGEAAFATLFVKYAKRWQEGVQRAEADKMFAERERSGGRS